MSDQDPKPSATPEWKGGEADEPQNVTFEPTMQQINRTREQGGGVGVTELNGQRDPTRYDSAEKYGSGQGRDLSPEPGGGEARPKSGSDSAESLDDVRDQFGDE
jgi:hypothetical protein